MTLADFKNKMKSTLSSIYESDELNSIFYLISEEFLQIPRSKILLADEIELDSNKEGLFLDALDRLKKNEPVQYVLGKAAFMNLEFNVNSNVLIPRPETEELVRLMLKEDLDGKEILDIGTGSGCIAISLAKNLPKAKVSALDISEEALEVARENAKLNNVDIQLKKFLEIANDLNLDCIIETHDEHEIKRALKLNYPILGINNRNLKNLKTDINNTASLFTSISKDYTVIAESGIKSSDDIKMYNDLGIFNFLIGESILRSNDYSTFIKKLLDHD